MYQLNVWDTLFNLKHSFDKHLREQKIEALTRNMSQNIQGINDRIRV